MTRKQTTRRFMPHTVILLGTLGILASTALAQEKQSVEDRIRPMGKVNVGTSPAKTAAKPASQPVAVAPAKPAAATATAQAAAGTKAGDPAKGKNIVETTCSACHKTGVLNAPKTGDGAAWAPRIKQGQATLVEHVLKGFNAMPPRAGNPSLTDEQARDAVAYMVAQAAGKPASTPPPLTKAKPSVPEKLTKVVAPTPKTVPKASPKPAAVAAAAPKAAAKPVRRTPSTGNRFNRLMKPKSQRNPPPAKDGIHDPENDGTHMLQPPKEAFAGMDKGRFGNRVDWVKSLQNGKINPRYDRLDPTKAPIVMDLNIVREVKGSMPNVVYPHKQHTEWLDCSNCHPAIFIPKKGANIISMAAILLGQKCGVCHGKVAFPVSDCRKCHSQKKAKTTTKKR